LARSQSCGIVGEMNGRLLANSVPTVPQRRKRGRPKTPAGDRDSSLGARELELHATLKADGRLKSGKSGGYVYYIFHGRQCWRRDVRPRDPRTPPQLSARLRLTIASRAWSESRRLTEQSRQGWRAAAARVQSRPRLYQQGPLTGQQLFVARNCARQQTGRKMLWEPSQPEAQTAGAKPQGLEPLSQASQPTRVAPSLSGLPRCHAVDVLRPHHRARGAKARSGGGIMPSQITQPQSLPRPPSERFRIATGVAPAWCRCTGGRLGHSGRAGSWKDRTPPAANRTDRHGREL
jgi:hypothetical protein